MISSDFWLGRRVLITGHTGLKGAWLSLMLARLNAAVTGYALAPPSDANAFDSLGAAALLADRRGDICDRSSLQAAMDEAQPEIVFHLAAQSLVRRGYADPIETYRANVLGTATVLDCARHLPSVRLVVIVTTDKCYENGGAGLAFQETDRLGGSDPYSASKACAELVATSYRQSFFADGQARIVTVRAGNVIGGADFAADRIIPDAVRAFEAGETLAVRNPRAIRPWQHVMDPLRGYLVIAERALSGQPVSDAYNFGPGPEGECEVRDLLDAFASAWARPTAWRPDPSLQPKEAAALRLDIGRARAELGWQPLLPIAETVSWTAEWYRAFADGDDMVAFSREQADRYLGQCVKLVVPRRPGRTEADPDVGRFGEARRAI